MISWSQSGGRPVGLGYGGRPLGLGYATADVAGAPKKLDPNPSCRTGNWQVASKPQGKDTYLIAPTMADDTRLIIKHLEELSKVNQAAKKAMHMGEAGTQSADRCSPNKTEKTDSDNPVWSKYINAHMAKDCEMHHLDHNIDLMNGMSDVVEPLGVNFSICSDHASQPQTGMVHLRNCLDLKTQ